MKVIYSVILQQVTVPKPFNLGLNKRVAERQQFRKDQAKRQNEVEKRDLIAKKRDDEEAKKELKEFRRSLDFKVREEPSICVFVCVWL